MSTDAQPETRDIQLKMLDILLYFKNFCEAHQLSFFLAGGTCLGAVRHKGFIPWDDDVDVFMFREDYEKLPTLWAEYADSSRYACVRSDEKVNIHHSAIEIKDSNTTFINQHSVDLDIHQGLMIDVIPLDTVATGSFAKIRQMLNSMLFCCFNFQRLPEHKSKLTYTLTKIALTVISSPRTRYRIWKRAEEKFSSYSLSSGEYVASFVEGVSIMRLRFPKAWFLTPATAVFEGHEMPVPADTDAYLRMSYGNYMELPPEEERIPRHNSCFIDLEHSYTQYRGVKYCIGQNLKP